MSKEHWCQEYQTLQRNLSKTQEVAQYPRGKPTATGYGGGFCDNENLLGGNADPFHGSQVGEQELNSLHQSVESARKSLNTHRQSCPSCITVFQRVAPLDEAET